MFQSEKRKGPNVEFVLEAREKKPKFLVTGISQNVNSFLESLFATQILESDLSCIFESRRFTYDKVASNPAVICQQIKWGNSFYSHSQFEFIVY